MMRGGILGRFGGLGRVVVALVFTCVVLVPASTASAVESRTEDEVRARWRQLAPSYSGSPYLVTPSWASPYSTGALRQEFQQDGLNIINYARYLAGLPDDVTLDASYTDSAQHGAVLLAAGQFAHTQPKPDDMDEAFYQIAVRATSSSNIGWGYDSLWRFNRGGLDDDDAANIDRAGHRRWLLNPQMAKTGMGYASNRSDTYVFDMGRTSKVAYDAILWPSAGPFPVEMLGTSVPWSVTLNPGLYSWTPGSAGHTVTLRRLRDSKTWTFTSADTDKSGEYFNFDTAGYGVSNCFIFRPDPSSVGAYEIGDEYEVTLSGGITSKADGSPAVIAYTTRFISQASDDRPPPDPGVSTPTTLTLVGPPGAPSYNGSAMLSATLKTASGAAVLDATVVFERWTGTRWLPIGTSLTNSSGVAVKYAGGLTTKQTYRARFELTESYGASTSRNAYVSPKASVANPAAPTYAYRSRSFYISGCLKPHHTAGTYPVRIYKYRYVLGVWKSYGFSTAKALDYSDYTKYARSISVPYVGRWRLRAYAPADSGHVATWSSGYDEVIVK